MRMAFGVGLLVVSFLTQRIAAQPAPPEPAPQHRDATGEEIKALELKLADLILRGDWAEYEKYVAPDFTRIDDAGRFETRDEFMSGLKNGGRKVIVMEPEDLVARSYGETAVLQGQLTIWVRDSGRVSKRHDRFTEVFLRRDDQWHLAVEQDTAVGK